MGTITAYKDCKNCKYLEVIDKFYMHCTARDKKYMYGQAVPCEDKEKTTKKKEKQTHEQSRD